MTAIAAEAFGSFWRHIAVSVAPALASRWIWCLAAVLAYMAFGIGYSVRGLPLSLGDTDDAMRLVQVRAFLDGAGWYNTTLDRIGGATPLVSHWSRLIDLPIAVLLMLLSTVMSASLAELTVRAIWPMIVLAVFLRLLLTEAEARGGHKAVGLTLFLALTCLTGLYQFSAGRIDHHNVMIVGAVAGLLRLSRAAQNPSLGWQAGALLGGSLVIGLESMALLIPLVGLGALAGVVNVRWLHAARNTVAAIALTLAAGLAVTIHPSQWLSSPCDQIGLNLVVLFAVGAATLESIHRFGRTWAMSARVTALSAGGVVGAALYVTSNTVCLRGPFGAVSADANRYWLSTVIEGQPLLAQFEIHAFVALSFIVFSIIAFSATLRHAQQKRDVDSTALSIAALVSIALAFWMTKFVPYASFILAFGLAQFLATVKGTSQISPLVARIAGAGLLNQVALTMLVAPLLPLVSTTPTQSAAKLEADAATCSETPTLRALAALPAGTMVAHWNLGPAIAALTPHTVLSGPYHRIDVAIMETRAIYADAPDKAEQRLRRVNATYIVQCVVDAPTTSTVRLHSQSAQGSLQSRLVAGEHIPFLREVSFNSPTPHLRAWEVLPLNAMPSRTP